MTRNSATHKHAVISSSVSNIDINQRPSRESWIQYVYVYARYIAGNHDTLAAPPTLNTIKSCCVTQYALMHCSSALESSVQPWWCRQRASRYSEQLKCAPPLAALSSPSLPAARLTVIHPPTGCDTNWVIDLGALFNWRVVYTARNKRE